MSAAFAFSAPVTSVEWINQDTAAIAKCGDCRWVGNVHRIADQLKGKRRASVSDREDSAYQAAFSDGIFHLHNGKCPNA